MRVSIDSAGRIVVPQALRRQLGLRPGTQLDARVEEGRLVAIPMGPGVVVVEEGGRLVATTIEPLPDMSHQELLDIIDETRAWQRDR